MRRQQARVRGSYLLEAAVVTFGLAAFLVGASDVARIFHARNALRAGVREGLRCLYPTDAGCSVPETQPGTPGAARFNVDVWDNLSLYAVPRNVYSAQASWVTEPELVTPRESQRVSEAVVDLARDRFRRHSVLFPVRGHHPHLLQTRSFPIISGPDPLNPIFRDRDSHRQEQPHKVVDISSISGSIRGQRAAQNSGFESGIKIGTAAFSLRDAWPAWREEAERIARIEAEHDVQVPCYAGTLVGGASQPRLDWRASGAPARCSYRGAATLFSRGSLKVPVMFRVSGTTRGTEAGAQGKALLSLRWEHSKESGSQDLGGRLISPGGNGNFVVRGATLDDIAERYRGPYEGDGPYRDEIRSHGSIVLLPVDAKVYLEFSLASLNGRQVSWQGQRLEIFYPSFSLVDETYSCEYSASPAACRGEIPVEPLFTSLDRSRALRSEPAIASQCSREKPPGYQENPEGYLAQLRAMLNSGQTPRAETFWAKDAAPLERCVPQRKRVSCVGKPREYLKGCGVCDAVQARVLPEGCADRSFDPRRDVVSAVSCQRAAQASADRRRACSGEKLPACAAKHSTTAGRVLLEGSAEECPVAETQSPPALLSDPLPVSTCGDEPSIAEEYRQRYGVPEGIAIPITKITASDELRLSPPPGQCTPYRHVAKPGQRRPCGALLSSEGAARCCAANEGRCAITPVLLSPGGSRGEGSNLRLDRARERAFATIEAAYPPSRRATSCLQGAENCVAVVAEHQAGPDEVSLKAEAAVPLRLMSVVGGTQVTISHTETRVLERRFTRD